MIAANVAATAVAIVANAVVMSGQMIGAGTGVTLSILMQPAVVRGAFSRKMMA
jgi:hypothetical protein